MRDPADATTANSFPAARRRSRSARRLVQRAPGPEAPSERDRAGAQRGMIIALIGGGAFWGGVVATAVYLLR
jgi:hypothetical protein